jgi:hypothetical protein
MLRPIEVKRRPKTIHQARFNLPWCLGKVALDGQLGLSAFTSEYLRDPAILSFAAIVDYEMLEVDSAKVPQDEVYAGIRVLTKDGRSLKPPIRPLWRAEPAPRAGAHSRKVPRMHSRVWQTRAGRATGGCVLGMAAAATLTDLTKCIDALVKDST